MRRKALTLLITLVLSLTLAGYAHGETWEETWYSQSRGMTMELTLVSDGSYTFTIAGNTRSGIWIEQDGGIVLDEEEHTPLYRIGDQLLWSGMNQYLTSSPPVFGDYAPADVLADEETGDLLSGYWRSIYVNVDGAILPSWELNDVTDVYVASAMVIDPARLSGIEGYEEAAGESDPEEMPEMETEYVLVSGNDGPVKVALGGPLFGDVVVDMAFENGALTWAEDEVSVTLQIQEDGLMRMSLSAPDSDLTLYLLPQYIY